MILEKETALFALVCPGEKNAHLLLSPSLFK
jgi:hypothetical protein